MCFFYGCQNKQRSFPCPALSGFYGGSVVCLLCGGNWITDYSSSSGISLSGRAMGLAVIHRPLPPRLGFNPRSVRVRFEVATKWHSPGTSVFPRECHSTNVIYSFLSTARNLPQAMLSRKSSSNGQQSTFTPVVFDGESRDIRVFPRDVMSLLC